MPAFLLSPLVRWGIVAVVIALLGAGLLWFKHEAKLAREAQAIAETARDLAQQDADRWQDAAKQRDGVIAGQAAEISRLEADAALATQIAAEKLAAAQQRAQALQTQNRNLKEAARERPQDVRDLGPIVRSAVGSLRN